MKNKIKIKDLQTLARTINQNIVNVNNGGCCVFAALVSERLKDFYDVNVNVYGYNIGVSIDDARSTIKKQTLSEWNNKGVNFGHVVVEYKDKRGIKREYDSTGNHKADGSICYEYNKTEGHLTLKETKILASRKAGWNKSFDRKQIPTMKRIINNFFDEYNKA